MCRLVVGVDDLRGAGLEVRVPLAGVSKIKSLLFLVFLSLTYILAYSPTDSHTYSTFTHPLTDRLNHSLTHSLINLLTHSLTDLLTDLLTH